MVQPRPSRTLLLAVFAAMLLAGPLHGFAPVSQRIASASTATTKSQQQSLLVSSPLFSTTSASAKTGETDAADVPSTTSAVTNKDSKKQALRKKIREEGGRLAFNTKYGALNPFGIYYGFVAIALGIPWYMALSLYQVFAWVTRGKLDPQRRIPIFITQVWGTLLMRLTGCYPKMENTEILRKFFQT